MLLTWLFFTHESSRDGLAEIHEQLKKELNCQVRYIEPRELGTITANPQTIETSAVLNLLLRFSCLKAHKTFGTRREAFLFASLCLNPLWIRPVLSASQCCDSRRNSDSHVAAREKLLCTQARASSLPDPRPFKSFEWWFGCFLSLSSPCLPSQVPPCRSFPLCWKTWAATGGKMLGLLREWRFIHARRQKRDGFTVQMIREDGETAPECILLRRSCCWGVGKSSWTLLRVISVWGLGTKRWVGIWPDHCPFHQLRHSYFPWKEGVSGSALSLLREGAGGNILDKSHHFLLPSWLHCYCLRHSSHQEQWLNLYFVVALGEGS